MQRKRKNPFHLEPDEIEILLRANGWFQEDLAKEISKRAKLSKSLSQAAVSKWVTGINRPNKKLWRILIDIWNETFEVTHVSVSS